MSDVAGLSQLAFKQTKVAAVTLPGKAAYAATPAMSAEQAEKILAAFDLDNSFGPSVGLSRRDRWERAQQLGLDPPSEVRAALDLAHAQSVFTRAMSKA